MGARGQAVRRQGELTLDKVFADPQVQHLAMDTPVRSPHFGDTKLVSSPLNFTGVPRGIRSPAPEPGTHTDEVLGWLGYSREEMDQLRAAGVTQPADPQAATVKG